MLPYLIRPATWKLFLVGGKNGAARTPNVEEVTTFDAEGDLDVPGRPRIIPTPGHSPGHVCLPPARARRPDRRRRPLHLQPAHRQARPAAAAQGVRRTTACRCSRASSDRAHRRPAHALRPRRAVGAAAPPRPSPAHVRSGSRDAPILNHALTTDTSEHPLAAAAPPPTVAPPPAGGGARCCPRSGSSSPSSRSAAVVVVGDPPARAGAPGHAREDRGPARRDRALRARDTGPRRALAAPAGGRGRHAEPQGHARAERDRLHGQQRAAGPGGRRDPRRPTPRRARTRPSAPWSARWSPSACSTSPSCW